MNDGSCIIRSFCLTQRYCFFECTVLFRSWL